VNFPIAALNRLRGGDKNWPRGDSTAAIAPLPNTIYHFAVGFGKNRRQPPVLTEPR
jgi:hypothetical protein